LFEKYVVIKWNIIEMVYGDKFKFFKKQKQNKQKSKIKKATAQGFWDFTKW